MARLKRHEIVLIVFAIIFMALALAAAAHAQPVKHKSRTPVVHRMLPPIGPFPDTECKEETAGDIYIGPDNHFWECICEVRTFVPGPDCAWYDQGPPTQDELRRIRRKLHVRIVPRGTVIDL